MLNDSLVWLPERGMGYYPVPLDDAPYDADYFAKYQTYAGSDIGRSLNAYRVALVDKYVSADVVDIGIGCGTFIEARGTARTKGYDINPAGVVWLKDRGLYVDLYASEGVDAITCWDSLEHIPEPHKLLSRVKRYVFVSIPIFEGPDHVLASKHYRKDEHLWYFTHGGLIRWMAGYGFGLIESDDGETKAGREGIGTFVFKRVAQ